jgi:hypothetical protein
MNGCVDLSEALTRFCKMYLESFIKTSLFSTQKYIFHCKF